MKYLTAKNTLELIQSLNRLLAIIERTKDIKPTLKTDKSTTLALRRLRKAKPKLLKLLEALNDEVAP